MMQPPSKHTQYGRLSTPSLVVAARHILIAVLGLVFGLTSCATDSTHSTSAPAVSPAPVGLVIGPQGGTLAHPSGARVVVPPGALAAPTALTLKVIPAPDAASLGAQPLGQRVEIGPEGVTFRKPVDVIVPFDPTRLAPGASLTSVQAYMAAPGSARYTATQSTVDLAQRTVLARSARVMDIVPASDPAAIFITTPPALPQATVGVPYSQQLAATGGAPPYVWVPSGGSALPPGLALASNGSLSGTATLPSTYAFFVTVADTHQRRVQMALSLVVLPPANPAPTLARIDPSSASQGDAAQTITLTGTGFVPVSRALWDGAPLDTTFVSATSLAASVPTALLATAGTHHVSVSSPAPGGGASGALDFVVVPVPQNPVPTVAGVSPSRVPVSTIDTEITVTGSDFVAGTSVTIGTQTIPTQLVSAGELRAIVPSSFLASAGALTLGASTPPPGGGFSATTATLTVGGLNPVPTLASLSPSSTVAGSSDLTLTAAGTGFVPGGQMFFGTIAIATTIVDDHTATAVVPSALLATVASVPVTFLNPVPGGGASGSSLFTIAPSSGGGALRTACDRAFVSTATEVVTVAGVAASGSSTVVVGTAGPGVDFGDGSPTRLRGPFVAKYDASCHLVWGGATDTSSLGNPTAVAADADGNVFVTTSSTFATGGLLAFGPDGSPRWSHAFQSTAAGATGRVSMNHVGTDALGNVFVAATVLGDTDFGSGLLVIRRQLAVVAKFHGDGANEWAFPIQVPDTLEVTDLDVDSAGRSVVSAIDQDVGGARLSVFDAAGGAVLTRTLAGTGAAVVVAGIDDAGDVLAAGGLMSGPIDLGDGSLVGAAGDSFVAKYDAAGNHVWSRLFAAFAGTSSAIAAVRADHTGNVYAAGEFSGTLDLGGGPLSSGSGGAVFVTKLAAGGASLGARLGTTTRNTAFVDGLSLDGAGDAVVVGTFGAPLDFGVGPLIATSSLDGFLVRFFP